MWRVKTRNSRKIHVKTRNSRKIHDKKKLRAAGVGTGGAAVVTDDLGRVEIVADGEVAARQIGFGANVQIERGRRGRRRRRDDGGDGRRRRRRRGRRGAGGGRGFFLDHDVTFTVGRRRGRRCGRRGGGRRRREGQVLRRVLGVVGVVGVVRVLAAERGRFGCGDGGGAAAAARRRRRCCRRVVVAFSHTIFY